jgi:hypothetical protein
MTTDLGFQILGVLLTSTAVLWLWLAANYTARATHRSELSPGRLIVAAILASIFAFATGIFSPSVQ